MIREEIFLLLVAKSTHLVIKAESLLKDSEIVARIIPLPTEISGSCGLSIKFDVKDLELVKSILKSNEITLEIYRVKKNGIKKVIDKI